MSNNVETLKTPLTGIVRDLLPDSIMAETEAWIAQQAGKERVIVSPNVWAAKPEENPEASEALGGIAKMADGIMRSNRLYEGVTTVTANDEAGRPHSMAFIADPQLTRRQLEDVRGEVVTKVNGLLQAVGSQYQL